MVLPRSLKAISVKIMRSSILVVLLGFIAMWQAAAATYYIAPGGSDKNSCSTAQSSSGPKATFSSAWGCLNAGDTLIVMDGTYNQSIAPPSGKSGSAGSVITVAAANDGAAKVNGYSDFKGSSYLTITGLKLTGPSNSAVVTLESKGTGSPSHHLTFQRVGFQCALTGSADNDNACLDIGDGAHDNLIEDSWVWGGGRYSILCYGGPGGNPPNTTCDNNTFRRIVIRMGPNKSSGGNPQAGLSLYYASNNVVENVIVLDSVPASDSSNAAFYITTHTAPPNASGNKFYGVMALNNLGSGWYLDHDGTANNNELHDSVIWGSAEEGVSLYTASQCNGSLIDHVTVGKSGADGLWNNCVSTVVKSSMFYANKGTGLNQSSSRGSLGTEGWNLISGNGSASKNIKLGSTDLTVDPALKYIARVESGSPCVGKGEGGSNCGADLSMRYQGGLKTSTALWPWANEARLKQEMCADSGISSGFCGAPSLTYYVWTTLGNPVPSNFGGSGSTPVISPCDLNSDGSVNSTDVNISVSQALGQTACTTADLQKNGICNIVDVQRVVNASLGLGCVTP